MIMLKAAVDVYYNQSFARAACVLFETWTAREAFSTHIATMEAAAAYKPGFFYRRELPPVLHVLQQVKLSLIDTIVIDGYVYLGDNGRKGLGAYLYEALGREVPVIGVAKTAFHGNAKQVTEVYRGKSQRALFVSAVGIDLKEAAENIRSMAGEYRVPDLLRYLDQKTRERAG